MLKKFSKTIGSAIVRMDDGYTIALLSDIIIEPDTGKIAGLWLKPLTLPIRNGVIKSDSVLEWKNKIYIKDESDIGEPQEIIRLNEILTKKAGFIGNNVMNEAGEYLGRVEDIDFDSDSMVIQKLYVKKRFLGIFTTDTRIFSKKDIIEVRSDYILVKDTEKIIEPVKNAVIREQLA